MVYFPFQGVSEPAAPGFSESLRLRGGSGEGTAGGAAGLRLRGGAAGQEAEEPDASGGPASSSQADAITVAANVEVMNDDEGLRGCWYVLSP